MKFIIELGRLFKIMLLLVTNGVGKSTLFAVLIDEAILVLQA